jgi:hypothetical protein
MSKKLKKFLIWIAITVVLVLIELAVAFFDVKIGTIPLVVLIAGGFTLANFLSRRVDNDS